MSLDSDEKKQLADGLLRALNAMQGWSAARRLHYEVTLGVLNRQADFTQDFGGEAMPEPDSVAWLSAPGSASLPLIKLLYVLRQSDDICLNAPTARSIMGAHIIGAPITASLIPELLRLVKDAQAAQLVRQTAQPPKELIEADRDSILGLTLTEAGKRYLDDVLHPGEPRNVAAPRAVAARRT